MKSIENNQLEDQTEQSLSFPEVGPLTALAEGLHQEVGDFVKLELTAEEMLREEAMLLRAYVVDDAKNFWRELRCEVMYWELTAGALMLRAADPVQAEWQRQGWWHK